MKLFTTEEIRAIDRATIDGEAVSPSNSSSGSAKVWPAK